MSDDDYLKSTFAQTVLFTFALFISPLIIYYTYTGLRNWFQRRRQRKQPIPLTQQSDVSSNGQYTDENISVIIMEAHDGCHNTKNVCSAGYPSNLKAGMWSQHNDGLPSYSDVCGPQSRY